MGGRLDLVAIDPHRGAYRFQVESTPRPPPDVRDAAGVGPILDRRLVDLQQVREFAAGEELGHRSCPGDGGKEVDSGDGRIQLPSMSRASLVSRPFTRRRLT